MGPQMTRRLLAEILAVCVFAVFIAANPTFHHNLRVAHVNNLSVEDQKSQLFYEDLLRSLETALTSKFNIAFSIEQLADANPTSMLLLPSTPRFDLSVRGPPHAIHS